MLKKIKDKNHSLSLAKKITFTSIMIIVLSIFVLTVVVQFFFEKSVLEITGEGYRQKFDVASKSSQKILEDGERITKVLLTDKSVQEWLLEEESDEAKRLRQKLQVEQRLDYLDALYPEDQYSIKKEIWSIPTGFGRKHQCIVSFLTLLRKNREKIDGWICMS